MQAICSNGSSARSTAGANGNAVFFGISDKVPNNEIIIHIAHAADDADLIFQTLQIAGRGIFIPLSEALHAKMAEIFLIGKSLRNGKSGQMIFIKHKLQIAAICNFRCIFESLITTGEQLAQFLFAFEIELLPLESHTVLVIHGLAGLDAQQYILHGGIFFTKVVGIIGHHQGQTGFTGDPVNALIDRLLLIDTVILQLQIKISVTEDLMHF